MQQALDIIIAILTTYGLATLLSEYDGPDDLFLKLRKDNKVFECAVCLSPWVALLPALLLPLGLIEYLGVIGATIILLRQT